MALNKETDQRSYESRVIASIMAREFNEQVRSIIPLVGGSGLKKVFEVVTKSSQCILRISFDYDLTKIFLKEKCCIEKTSFFGVPSPQVLAIGKQGHYSYIIQTKVPGVMATQYRGDLMNVWEQVGAYARLFHQIDAVGFGNQLLLSEGFDGGNGIDDWLEDTLEYIFGDHTLLHRQLLISREWTESKRLLERIANWKIHPKLSHGNISLKNIMVDQNGKIFFLDWETACGHIAPQFDLAAILIWVADQSAIAGFLKGYRLTQAEFKNMSEELRLLQLCRILHWSKWICIRKAGKTAELQHSRDKITELLNSLR